MASPLTQRQQEVILLKSLGLSNKQVADKLKISPSTVGLHVSGILKRTESKNITEAVGKWSQQNDKGTT